MNQYFHETAESVRLSREGIIPLDDSERKNSQHDAHPDVDI